MCVTPVLTSRVYLGILGSTWNTVGLSMPQLSLYLSDDLAAALKRRAEADRRSLSNYVGRLLSGYLETAPCPDCGSTDPGHATPCGALRRKPHQVDLEELTSPAGPDEYLSAPARTVDTRPQGRTARRARRGK